mmetsp:Transcript_55494/g.82215  ORF Transcript_55494/g.82215 Transcript_55494/m.82215 type:complete len:215 (-) Transcript_55494:96-740(-)|eukprot:CAMPEP_0195538904 /NCGR_PEP_ID=MMETSP0794_2-20130614/49777_1 /TAXON_ID=515487 /ORGANISM="Stephanopyxis turris, Strain CCMP 815" /LENGTH=214 /DNA_ID=CAMNT_0040672915 /DNA_START=886 /DNA_END=1530 /DNA_ORIENTATION=-
MSSSSLNRSCRWLLLFLALIGSCLGGRTMNMIQTFRGGADDSPGSDMIEKILKDAGVDGDKFKELMDSMGGENGKMPDLSSSMNMMKDMMNSPMFQEYMTDPERLEQSRQMILGNPEMKKMMEGMPGFEDILNDKEKWAESMIAAAEMYKSMGGDLMNALTSMSPEMLEGMAGGLGGLGGGMGGGLGGVGGSLGGLGGLPNANPALDELGEADE